MPNYACCTPLVRLRLAKQLVRAGSRIFLTGICKDDIKNYIETLTPKDGKIYLFSFSFTIFIVI